MSGIHIGRIPCCYTTAQHSRDIHTQATGLGNAHHCPWKQIQLHQRATNASARGNIPENMLHVKLQTHDYRRSGANGWPCAVRARCRARDRLVFACHTLGTRTTVRSCGPSVASAVRCVVARRGRVRVCYAVRARCRASDRLVFASHTVCAHTTVRPSGPSIAGAHGCVVARLARVRVCCAIRARRRARNRLVLACHTL